MMDELLWGFSVVSLVFCSLRGLRKAFCMVVSLYSPSSSASGFPPPRPTSWIRHLLVATKRVSWVPENSRDSAVFKEEDDRGENALWSKKACPQTLNLQGDVDQPLIVKSKSVADERPDIPMGMMKLRKKRPGKLVVPGYCQELGFSKLRKLMENEEIEVQGTHFCLASKKGRREILEDAYAVTLDISGDPKHAFFAVVDGHGGRCAADYVAENLGKNIITTLEKNPVELAIRRGHQITDEQFLSQGVGSGACAASVVLKDGELNVANVGDCRVVISINGVATALTKQHRLCREDERLRIENTGGLVECKNGVWRVQGSLAVSRAIGDGHMKEWGVISEPEIERVRLSPECEFLIMGSDGLWEKVEDQEAVDQVLKHKGMPLKACKALLDMSFTRGNADDATVMLVHLRSFIIH